tara:strand:- start:1760 stop:3142 length:1383 start_codon:yes stop_codon:yes gene_type:complete
MGNTRIETDSMGELQVEANALYGPQTQRAINNFSISGQKMPEEFIRSLLIAKSAAATVNKSLNQISDDTADAICQAIETLLNDKDLMKHFPVDVYQTGSGTSTNMNANEVIATIASKKSNLPVSANDHVNYGQSSNDIIPSTIHISAALALEFTLLPALEHLSKVIRSKAKKLESYIKTGRTHLMDAMPIKLSQSLDGWAEQIALNIARLKSIQPQLHTLAQGGTAVGTGINAHPDFSHVFTQVLSKKTNLEFTPAHNFFSHISSQDIAVSLSGLLKATSVSILKISNDLRWMNSGPLAGLGEIELEALQPGSSIMPGKVNPVIPEAAAMVSAQVIGNDSAITIAGQSGNFELNVMLPLIANNLLNSIKIISNVSFLLADKAIASFKVNEEKLTESLSRNPILVTALNPIIGYLKASEIAKKAYKEKRPIIDVAAEQTELPIDELKKLLDPKKLTNGGLS